MAGSTTQPKFIPGDFLVHWIDSLCHTVISHRTTHFYYTTFSPSFRFNPYSHITFCDYHTIVGWQPIMTIVSSRSLLSYRYLILSYDRRFGKYDTERFRDFWLCTTNFGKYWFLPIVITLPSCTYTLSHPIPLSYSVTHTFLSSLINPFIPHPLFIHPPVINSLVPHPPLPRRNSKNTWLIMPKKYPWVSSKSYETRWTLHHQAQRNNPNHSLQVSLMGVIDDVYTMIHVQSYTLFTCPPLTIQTPTLTSFSYEHFLMHTLILFRTNTTHRQDVRGIAKFGTWSCCTSCRWEGRLPSKSYLSRPIQLWHFYSWSYLHKLNH